jgi:cell division protein FtsL
MIRPGALVWIGAIVAVAVALFLITYQVKNLEAEIEELNREAEAQEEAIHVLNAEWGFLNRPDRLADLAERHLALAPVNAAQLSAAKTLDWPPAPFALTTARAARDDAGPRAQRGGALTP